jgi:hypothetical protein
LFFIRFRGFFGIFTPEKLNAIIEFAECFRVLAPDGVLVFKWNETQVKVGEVLALTPVAPLFGHISGRKGLTHWLVFMNPKIKE